MSRNYDNWERLVAAVLKREQLWQLFHAQSRSPSISSESSGFSFSFCLTSSLEDAPISSPEWAAFNHSEKGGDIDYKTSSIPGEDQSEPPVENPLPDKDVTSKPFWKRVLKIQVANQGVPQHIAISPARDSSECCPKTSPRMTSPTSGSRVHTPAVNSLHSRAGKEHSGWPINAKQESHPLPLPPSAVSNSSPFSGRNSAATSPSVPSRSPERVENSKSSRMRWKKGKLIGKDLIGDVYLGFNSEKGEMCAMKEVTLSSAKSKLSARALEKEIALLSGLRHPNIVQYCGSETVGDKSYICFEYVSSGSIYKILQEYGKLGESVIRSYTRQILSGLEYLHSKNIAHGDIKGANILVDPNGIVKLCSFGFEKHIIRQSRPSFLTDSPYWIAPEAIMNSNVCNLAIDIWSLGCTVVEMATSKPPMSQYDGIMAMFKVVNNKELPIIPDRLSDEGKDFLRHCLQWNPLHRATASQLLEHPFVKILSPLEKQVLVSRSPRHPEVTDSVKSEGIAHARSLHQLCSGLSSGASKSSYHNMPYISSNTDYHTPRYVSAPVSPVGGPLPSPASPQHLNGQVSPPPISSPFMASPSSTPQTGGIGAIPYSQPKQSAAPQEAFYNFPKQSHIVNRTSYWDPNILHGLHSGTHAFQETTSSDDYALGKQFGKAANRQLYGQSVLDVHGSQQLHRAPVKLNPSFI